MTQVMAKDRTDHKIIDCEAFETVASYMPTSVVCEDSHTCEIELYEEEVLVRFTMFGF